METINFRLLLSVLAFLIFSSCSSIQSSNKNNPRTNTINSIPVSSEESSNNLAIIPSIEITVSPVSQTTNTSSAFESEYNTMFAETTSDELEQPLTVWIEYWYSRILLQDISTGKYREIYYQDPVGFWGWSNNGCELFVGPMGNFEGAILRMDLQGNVLGEVIKFNWDSTGGITMGGSVSPNEKNVAYIIGNYEEPADRDPQIFNLLISQISRPQLVYKLTQNGGAKEAVWSSNGSLIAFTGYDKKGIHQLFVSKPNATDLMQLTSFNDPDNEIHLITWDPDDKKIAFYYGHPKNQNETGSESIILVTVGNYDGEPVIIQNINEDKIYFVNDIWWNEDNTLLADIRFYPAESLNRGLYWIDLGSNKIVSKILQSQTPEKTWNHVIVFAGKLGFIVEKYLWVYELNSEKYFRVEIPVDGISFWTPTQRSYKGERYCVP